MNKIFIGLVFSLLMAGCSKNATEADFKKIKIGMSEKEVIEILGEPETTFEHPQFKEFKNLEYKNESRVLLANKKVDSVVVNNKTILTKETESPSKIE